MPECTPSKRGSWTNTWFREAAGTLKRNQNRLLVIAVLWCAALSALSTSAAATDAGYTRYKDPHGRFAFDYPSTMQVRTSTPDEVLLFHPSATLRISVFIEKRSRRGEAKVEPFLAAFKQRLKHEMKESVVLDEGKPQGTGDAGYLVCGFKDQRGMDHVQLVHYVVGEEKVLQMIISDRPAGFTNLESVIRKVHGSLTITDGGLK